MPAMRATEPEFRYRFAFNTGLLLLAFGAYALDRVNAGAALLSLLGLRVSVASLRALYAAGAVAASMGTALRAWASAFLSGAVVHDSRIHADRLVADGPYRYVRHPLYLAAALLRLGQVVLASRSGALLLLVAVPWLQARIIAREEADLSAALGAPYLAYRARVPCYLPALSPRVPPSGVRPSWREGAFATLPFGLSALALWIFVLTLDWRAFGATTLVALALARPLALRERCRRVARDADGKAASEPAGRS